MKKILLYGHLAKKFGKSFTLDVKSPAEALRALRAILPGFEKHIRDNSEPGYKVFNSGRSVGQNDLTLGTSSDIIRIVPVVAGAGKGFGQIILGVILLVVSYFFPPAAGFLVPLGKALILGGVSQMLFAPNQVDTSLEERPDSKASFNFDNVVNTHREGGPVPTGSGSRMRTGGQVISSGLFTSDVPV